MLIMLISLALAELEYTKQWLSSTSVAYDILAKYLEEKKRSRICATGSFIRGKKILPKDEIRFFRQIFRSAVQRF